MGWKILSPRGLDRGMEDNERESGLLSDISHSLSWCILGDGALGRQEQGETGVVNHLRR